MQQEIGTLSKELSALKHYIRGVMNELIKEVDAVQTHVQNLCPHDWISVREYDHTFTECRICGGSSVLRQTDS